MKPSSPPGSMAVGGGKLRGCSGVCIPLGAGVDGCHLGWLPPRLAHPAGFNPAGSSVR